VKVRETITCDRTEARQVIAERASEGWACTWQGSDSSGDVRLDFEKAKRARRKRSDVSVGTEKNET
jgi:hypothetical protein